MTDGQIPTGARRAGMPFVRLTAAAALALAALALLPDVVHACPVCFDASDENRKAFFATAVFLSLFPLGMVAGAGLWLRKRAREVDGGERDESQRIDG